MNQDLVTTYTPHSNLIIIVGNYGSGKTEVAVNLAACLRQSGKQVQIADLDIVNPYFRCREARDMMEQLGIRVVIPPGAQQFADLPIVVPEIKGMLHPQGDQYSIFDVGGDDVGAIPLSSFVQSLGDSAYSLLQVINANRPFTNSLEGCLQMREKIERSSRLKVNGYVVNTHLMGETTAETILEGVALAEEVSRASEIPIAFVTAMAELAENPTIRSISSPILQLKRIMLPPWLRSEEKHDNSGKRMQIDPAGRTKPIGRP